MSVPPTRLPSARIGFAGTRHPHILQRARLLKNNQQAVIVGFVEADDAIAEQVEQRLSMKRFASLDALLDRGLDLAIIEALDPDVPPLARSCIGRVKSMLLEKPGAHRPKAAYDLAGPCLEAGTVVEFGYEMHYAQFMVVLRQVLASGCLGQVTLARLHGGSPVGCALELWQSLPEDLGGLGYTEGCHVIELATDLFGVPEAVSALTVRLPPGESLPSPFFKANLFSPPGEVTKVRVGTLEHEDLVTTTMVYPDKLVTIDLTAWEGGNWVQDWAAQIYGTNGTAQVDMGTEAVIVTLREARGGFPVGTTTFEGGQVGLGYMYERQLDSVLNRTFGLEATDQVGLKAGIDVLRVLAATYESAAAGAATMRVRGPL